MTKTHGCLALVFPLTCLSYSFKKKSTKLNKTSLSFPPAFFVLTSLNLLIEDSIYNVYSFCIDFITMSFLCNLVQLIDTPYIFQSPSVSTTPLALRICYLNLSIVILYQYPRSKITRSSGNAHIMDLFVASKHLMNKVLNISLVSRN